METMMSRTLGCRSATIERRAREVMGRNFFGFEKALKCFGVNRSWGRFPALEEIPFSEAMLKEVKNTHLLMAVLPLSILDIRCRVDPSFFFDQSWYNEEAFANHPGDACWQLVRKTPVVNSTSKDWSEQQSILSNNDEVPTARVMVYSIIGCYLATSEWLFDTIYVRTSSVDGQSNRVALGGFGSDWLYLNHWKDDERLSCLGLASGRRTCSLEF